MKKNLTPEDILAEHTPEVRALAELLRQLIRETIPEATEAAYPVWHGIGYRHPETGYFCAIFPFQDEVKLGFEYSVLLPDPTGLLHGDGRQVRYIHIRGQKDIRVRPLKALLRAAANLPGDRATKLALIRAGAKPVPRQYRTR